MSLYERARKKKRKERKRFHSCKHIFVSNKSEKLLSRELPRPIRVQIFILRLHRHTERQKELDCDKLVIHSEGNISSSCRVIWKVICGWVGSRDLGSGA